MVCDRVASDWFLVIAYTFGDVVNTAEVRVFSHFSLESSRNSFIEIKKLKIVFEDD